MMSFGEFVKKHRKRIGKTQRQLASSVGVGTSYLSSVENGAKSPFKEDVCIKIAEEIGVSAHTILRYRKQEISVRPRANTPFKRKLCREFFQCIIDKDEKQLIELQNLITKWRVMNASK